MPISPRIWYRELDLGGPPEVVEVPPVLGLGPLDAGAAVRMAGGTRPTVLGFDDMV